LVIKTLDPDSLEMLDPDPYPDPLNWKNTINVHLKLLKQAKQPSTLEKQG
jgi:hypothetical protein